MREETQPAARRGPLTGEPGTGSTFMEELPKNSPAAPRLTRIGRLTVLTAWALLSTAVVGAVNVRPQPDRRAAVHPPRGRADVKHPTRVVGLTSLSTLSPHGPAVTARHRPASFPTDLSNRAIAGAVARDAELLKPVSGVVGGPVAMVPVPAAPAQRPVAPVSAVVTPGVRQLVMEVTAYCACTRCCGPQAQGLTASGKRVSYNNGLFVAADTRLLPFGTRLQIPGYAESQPVEVIDRGGAIKGHRLDVYFHSHQEARKWGRRWIVVDVLP